MMGIRPIKATDYNNLHRIAIDSGYGFTSLLVNKNIFKKRINHSEKYFRLHVSEPGNQSYLFVMEGTKQIKLLALRV